MTMKEARTAKEILESLRSRGGALVRPAYSDLYEVRAKILRHDQDDSAAEEVVVSLNDLEVLFAGLMECPFDCSHCRDDDDA